MADETQPAQYRFGDLVQVGAIVRDIDQSMKVLSEVFGIGPWRVVSWPPEGRTDMNRKYYGRPAEFTALMALAALGPVEIELIQPLTGESIWADYLAEHGPGLHHIRCNVPDIEATIGYLAGHDVGVTQMASGIRPGTSWANFDTERLVGFTIEVMKPVAGTDGRTPPIVDRKVQA